MSGGLSSPQRLIGGGVIVGVGRGGRGLSTPNEMFLLHSVGGASGEIGDGGR